MPVVAEGINNKFGPHWLKSMADSGKPARSAMYIFMPSVLTSDRTQNQVNFRQFPFCRAFHSYVAQAPSPVHWKAFQTWISALNKFVFAGFFVREPDRCRVVSISARLKLAVTANLKFITRKHRRGRLCHSAQDLTLRIIRNQLVKSRAFNGACLWDTSCR